MNGRAQPAFPRAGVPRLLASAPQQWPTGCSAFPPQKQSAGCYLGRKWSSAPKLMLTCVINWGKHSCVIITAIMKWHLVLTLFCWSLYLVTKKGGASLLTIGRDADFLQLKKQNKTGAYCLVFKEVDVTFYTNQTYVFELSAIPRNRIGDLVL